MKTVFMVLLVIAPLFQTALAGEAREQLDAFHGQMKTLQAHFEQTLLSEKGEVKQQVSGMVYIQRPGQFRWDYSAPYEQMILANGGKVTIYDVDLEQVTVKKIDLALGQTPAAILSGESDLDADFYIFELEPKAGLQRVELAPKDKGGSFTRMRLGFEHGELKLMELRDTFGQLTSIVLSNVIRDQPLPPAIFEFKVPDGVDVVGDVD